MVRLTHSTFSVALKDPVCALSKHTPVRPTDRRIPRLLVAPTNATEVYWVPRPEWNITPSARQWLRAAMSSAAMTNSVRICSAMALADTGHSVESDLSSCGLFALVDLDDQEEGRGRRDADLAWGEADGASRVA